MVVTEQTLDEVRHDLVSQPPNYVVIRGKDGTRQPFWDFIWNPVYQIVTNRYVPCQRAGSYEIWSLPSNALAQCQLAEAAQARGQVAEAIALYGEALRLEPDLPVALNNLGWIRAANSDAKYRDGAEAVRLAERACRVTDYRQPILVGTLAAAYAEAGRFDEAVAMADKARQLALAEGRNDVAEKNQHLLDLFKAHQPCREAAPKPSRN
jgi:tetratricopeptide (TPR) repeat protein